MIFKEIIALYFKDHTKSINTSVGEMENYFLWKHVYIYKPLSFDCKRVNNVKETKISKIRNCLTTKQQNEFRKMNLHFDAYSPL